MESNVCRNVGDRPAGRQNIRHTRALQRRLDLREGGQTKIEITDPECVGRCKKSIGCLLAEVIISRR